MKMHERNGIVVNEVFCQKHSHNVASNLKPAPMIPFEPNHVDGVKDKIIKKYSLDEELYNKLFERWIVKRVK